jgi:hypothetical protein
MSNIAVQRLLNQRIEGSQFARPDEVVAWLGAVQAQDYPGALWSLGLRIPGSTVAQIEAAFNAGAILRTHAVRPTWHFVTPDDIRWILSLTAPRIKAWSETMNRRLGLDEALFRRSNEVIAKALQGGHTQTRAELGQALAEAGIGTQELRSVFIFLRAELEALVCSGRRVGKQFTYALLDERAPQARLLPRSEALAELARRYFTSHGPASLQDFSWWSGLPAADARAGLGEIEAQLVEEKIGGKSYWMPVQTAEARQDPPAAYLLPGYDEYLIAYRDRSAALDPKYAGNVGRGNGFFSTIVIDGRVVGNWRRSFKKGTVVIELAPFAPLSAAAEEAVEEAIRRYGQFLGMAVEVVFSGIGL